MAWIKPSLTANGQKRYKVQYHSPDGRTHSKTFPRSEDARQFARDIENTKRQGEYLNPADARKTLREYWPQFMQASPNLRPKSRELYESLARIHVLPVLGDYRLASLTVGDVNTFVTALESRGVRPPTVNAAFRLLSTILTSAENEGIVVRNPARRSGSKSKIKLPEMRRDEMRFLEPAEVHRLASSVPERYRALVLLLGFCGPRVGEALALRVSDLELLRRRLSITRTLTQLSDGSLGFGEPKTKGSRRALALPAFICDEIAAHLAKFPAGSDDLVFTAPSGGPVGLNNFRRQYWRPAVKRAGLDPLRIHDLRHTAVAIAIKAGAHPKQIQAMCGHSSITITLDRYGHAFDSLGEQLADLVDAIGREAADAPGAKWVPGAPRVLPWATGRNENKALTSGDAEIRTREGVQHPLTA